MSVLKRVIPCLDVDKGRVVKGTNFVGLRDAGDPVELAERYDAEGADELVFLDITASHEQRDTIVRLARSTADNVFIPFTIGGGIRSREDAQAVLDAGADKVSVNSAAVRRPELLEELAETFGAQCVVLAIDAKRTPEGGVRGVPERRPGRDRQRRGRMGARGRRARSGGDPAHQHGPRRHEGRLRHRADPRGRGRRRHTRDRLRRRGPAGAPQRGDLPTPTPTPSWSRRSSTTGSTACGRPRSTCARREFRCGSSSAYPGHPPARGRTLSADTPLARRGPKSAARRCALLA